jgi:hypothetical protein
MIWIFAIGPFLVFAGVLLYVLLKKPPVNDVIPWTPPQQRAEHVQPPAEQQPAASFDFNDVFSGAHRMPQPPQGHDEQPRA